MRQTSGNHVTSCWSICTKAAVRRPYNLGGGHKGPTSPTAEGVETSLELESALETLCPGLFDCRTAEKNCMATVSIHALPVTQEPSGRCAQ